MNRIKEVLEQKGIKQIWLSEQLGKSYNMVNSYVQNRRQPSIEDLYRIGEIIETKPSELLMDKKIAQEPLFEFKKAEIPADKIAFNIFNCFNKIKKQLEGNENNYNRFIFFLLIQECQKYLPIKSEDKSLAILSFMADGISFEKSIKDNAFNFDVRIKNLDVIKKQILRFNAYDLCTSYKAVTNSIIGILTEKLITKKESGAYYTSFETTEYIILNTLLPQIIYRWQKVNLKLKLHLENFLIDNGISFIEKHIKENSLFNAFVRLESKFNTAKSLSNNINDIKIIDISCGSGSFIFGVIDVIKKIDARIKEKINVDFKNLFGKDIDRDAVTIIKLRLIFERYLNSNSENSFCIANFKLGNALRVNENNLIQKRQIIEHQKYDVVLGNPPYVELRKINYNLNSYLTHKCNNLYALFLEEMLHLTEEGGHIGAIIPISYISTKRMNPVRQLLKINSTYEFCSSYADRPSCLFNGVHQKLNIILLQKETNSKQQNLYTSNYLHWYKEEKKSVFKSINYTSNNFSTKNFYYKVGNDIEKSIIDKLTRSKKGLLENLSLSKETKYMVWLNMRLCFWNKAFLKEQESKEYKTFAFDKETDAIIFTALINSNIFYFFWECISDAWHITNKDLENFRVDFADFEKDTRDKLSSLYLKFERNLETNKDFIGSKQTQYQYQHKKDKILIDKIDVFFSDYFNLTRQELLYIRNYQLQYRMNDEMDNYLKLAANECY